MAVVQTGDAGYTNQPSIHAQARWRVRLESHARRQATGRAVEHAARPSGIRTARTTQSSTSRLASRPRRPDKHNESASPPSRGGDDPLTQTATRWHAPAIRDATTAPSQTPALSESRPETTTEIDHARAAMSSTSRIKLPGTAAPTALSFRKQVSARFAPRPPMRAAGKAAGRRVPGGPLSTGVQAV